MSDDTYKVIFEGHLVDGHDPQTVKQHLAILFKANLSQIEKLFSGAPVTLKSDIDFPTAAKYEATLKKVGALCRITAISNSSVTSPPLLNQNAAAVAEQDVLHAFHGTIKPVPVPITYRLGLFLVGICMILLPVLYIALVATAVYAVYYHAMVNVDIFDRYSGAGALFIYIAPIIVGSILVIFMIKPLFAHQADAHKPMALNSRDEKRLYQFVFKICQIVGAPKPKRIDVDCEVNASASFRRGLFSFFGNDLVLTIGLPLIAGFNTRQLAGVLAHEFGHFAQGTGMRLTYVIRNINYWFSQVVYHRDSWDQKLEIWSRGIDIRIGIILYVARLFVWLTRKILWCFMIAGHTISCFMLRQMEFDADRYEAQLAGSKQFDTTSMRLRMVAAAAQLAYDDLAAAWDEHRLANNLPELIYSNVDNLPADTEKYFKQDIEQGNTSFFDTHPADRERIDNALKQQSEGVFQLEIPATTLFSNFKTISERATLYYYRSELGMPVKSELLITTTDITAQKQAMQLTSDALNSITAGIFDVHYAVSIDLDSITVSNQQTQTFDELTAVRGELAQKMEEAQAYIDRLNKADGRILTVHEAITLIESGFQINPRDFSLAKGDLEVAERALNKAVNEKINLIDRLQPLFQLVAKRIQLALSMLGSQKAFSITMPQQLRIEMESLIMAYYPFASVLNTLFDLRTNKIAMLVMLNNYEGNEDSEILIAKIQEIHKLILDQLHSVQSTLRNTPYLFEHGKGEISMATYVMEDEWDKEDIGITYQICEMAVDKISTLHIRLIGRLCTIAQDVEQALGLESLIENSTRPASQGSMRA